MIINETYDTIINKLDTYGINQKKIIIMIY